MIKQNQKLFSMVINQAGFTLVELLLYFALFSLIFIQLSSLYISILEAKSQGHALSSVERDGQYIMARLKYDIQRAETIDQPATLGGNSSTLVLTVDGTEYVYSVSSGRLNLSRDGNTLALNTQTDISNFSVQRLGNPGGKHTLQLQYTVTSPIIEHTGQENRDFQTTVGIR